MTALKGPLVPTWLTNPWPSLATLLARLMPTATVDKAVASLVKAASLLAAAEAAQHNKAAALTALAAEHIAEANLLSEEADEARNTAARAARVSLNLQNLLA